MSSPYIHIPNKNNKNFSWLTYMLNMDKNNCIDENEIKETKLEESEETKLKKIKEKTLKEIEKLNRIDEETQTDESDENEDTGKSSSEQEIFEMSEINSEKESSTNDDSEEESYDEESDDEESDQEESDDDQASGVDLEDVWKNRDFFEENLEKSKVISKFIDSTLNLTKKGYDKFINLPDVAHIYILATSSIYLGYGNEFLVSFIGTAICLKIFDSLEKLSKEKALKKCESWLKSIDTRNRNSNSDFESDEDSIEESKCNNKYLGSHKISKNKKTRCRSV